MRVVDTRTLITLPYGTVYLPVDVNLEGCITRDESGNKVYIPTVSPDQYGGLFIKEEPCFYNGQPSDWYYTDLLDTDRKDPTSWELTDTGKLEPCGSRDGFYEYDRHFMVLDDEDVMVLIEALLNRKSVT